MELQLGPDQHPQCSWETSTSGFFFKSLADVLFLMTKIKEFHKLLFKIMNHIDSASGISSAQVVSSRDRYLRAKSIQRCTGHVDKHSSGMSQDGTHSLQGGSGAGHGTPGEGGR